MADSAPSSLTEGERSFLVALNDLGVHFLLVGMSAALIQGARGATEVLDLWFEDLSDSRIGEAAARAGGYWVTRSEPPMLAGMGGRFDVVTTMSGLPSFADEYARSVQAEVDGVSLRLLPLDRIVVSKRAANRAKDQPAIHAIESAISVIDALKRKR